MPNATQQNVFVPRTIAPTASDIWWQQKYNPCLPRYNGTVLPNCVGYAYGRFCEIAGKFINDLPRCDAGMWIETLKRSRTSLTWGNIPKLGAVAVWKNPGKAGHVAIVEFINSDGTIMLSESGYSASWQTRFWNSGPRSGPNWYGNPYKFQGFIYNPATANVTQVVPYSGGIRYGQRIPDSSVKFQSTWDGSAQVLNCNYIEGSNYTMGANATYSTAPDHPARKFVRAAMSHAGSGFEWVKSTVNLQSNQSWSTATCCAAAKEAELDSVIPVDKLVASSFCRNIVDNYDGRFINGGANGGTDLPQTGDIFAIQKNSPMTQIKNYRAERTGIVRELQADTILTVEGDIEGKVVLNRRRLRDISWYIRPDWTKAGGTAECKSLMDNRLYETASSRSDATLREVAYLDNTYEPSIEMSNTKISAINYTSVLNSVQDVLNLQFGPSMNGFYGSDNYTVDSSGLSSPNAKVIFDFLLGKGLSAAQAVGFLANIEAESTFSPSAVNPGSGASGICQWMGGRKTKMIQVCGANWKNNLSGQLEYLWYELNGDESATLQKLKSEVTGNDLASAMQAADVILKTFERPGNYAVETPNRTRMARNLWEKIVVIQNSTGSISNIVSTSIVTSSGTNLSVGSSVPIPASVPQTGIIPNYTNYEGFFRKWNRRVNQGKLADIWDSQGRPSKYYIAMISGYFLVAVSTKFGVPGDIISVVLEDGSYFNAIIGDAKGSDATSSWGHVLSGKVDIIEWEAAGGNQDALKAGITQAGWFRKKVVKIVNYGSWLGEKV